MNGQIYGKAMVIGLHRNRRRSPLARRLSDAAGAAFDRLLAWQDRARSRTWSPWRPLPARRRGAAVTSPSGERTLPEMTTPRERVSR